MVLFLFSRQSAILSGGSPNGDRPWEPRRSTSRALRRYLPWHWSWDDSSAVCCPTSIPSLNELRCFCVFCAKDPMHSLAMDYLHPAYGEQEILFRKSSIQTYRHTKDSKQILDISLCIWVDGRTASQMGKSMCCLSLVMSLWWNAMRLSRWAPLSMLWHLKMLMNLALLPLRLPTLMQRAPRLHPMTAPNLMDMETFDEQRAVGCDWAHHQRRSLRKLLLPRRSLKLRERAKQHPRRSQHQSLAAEARRVEKKTARARRSRRGKASPRVLPVPQRKPLPRWRRRGNALMMKWKRMKRKRIKRKRSSQGFEEKAPLCYSAPL